MLACRVFGHRYRFTADGTQLLWSCERGCGSGGEKAYPSPEQAQRYAAAFDRRDADLGRRAPLLGMLPLRLWRWLRRRGGTGADRDAHRS